LRGRDGEGDLTNIQYKLIWNCHYESPLYDEYSLILNKKTLSPASNLLRYWGLILQLRNFGETIQLITAANNIV
jgi:hypothetical protein